MSTPPPRIESGPPSTLQRLTAERSALAAAIDALDAGIAAEVAALRAAGFSWAAVAAQLGCSKQAAQQRYSR